MKIYALHGFLGLPSDWAEFNGLEGVSLFDTRLPAPSAGLTQWGKAFNAFAEPGSLLLGYSLGGRLALHALCDNPGRWQGAILISAHPGLRCSKEKETRERMAFGHIALKMNPGIR